MEVWLYNVELAKSIKLEFQIEACYPTIDIFLVLINENETTTLFDGKDSKPYNSYVFRKVLSISKGYIMYENEKHYITIADFLDDFGKLEKCLIETNSERGYIAFDNDPESGNAPFKRFILVNYKEYIELKEFLKEEDVLPFKEFIKYKVSRQGNLDLSRRYQIPPFQLNDFVTDNGLSYFLDIQESDSSKRVKDL